MHKETILAQMGNHRERETGAISFPYTTPPLIDIPALAEALDLIIPGPPIPPGRCWKRRSPNWKGAMPDLPAVREWRRFRR